MMSGGGSRGRGGRGGGVTLKSSLCLDWQISFVLKLELFLLLLGGIFSPHLSGLCVCVTRLSITEICRLDSYCELTVSKKKKKKIDKDEGHLKLNA